MEASTITYFEVRSCKATVTTFCRQIIRRLSAPPLNFDATINFSIKMLKICGNEKNLRLAPKQEMVEQDKSEKDRAMVSLTS